MRGVVLAGGMGTRLRPVTEIYNKHLVLVYDKPMIYYPIKTLKDMGCDEITLVSGGEHIGGFAELLKDGRDLGVDITYRVQPSAGGIADALSCVEYQEGLFPVILGDNYFSEAPIMPTKPTIYITSVPNPEEYGVYMGGGIIEKPVEPTTNMAVIGLYVYDERVFQYIRDLKPSSRGELEVTDLNNMYLKDCIVQEYNGFWGDMGTPNGLLKVANYVKI